MGGESRRSVTCRTQEGRTAVTPTDWNRDDETEELERIWKKMRTIDLSGFRVSSAALDRVLSPHEEFQPMLQPTHSHLLP